MGRGWSAKDKINCIKISFYFNALGRLLCTRTRTGRTRQDTVEVHNVSNHAHLIDDCGVYSGVLKLNAGN